MPGAQLTQQLFCIAAGKPGGGSFLPHCYPDVQAPQAAQKVCLALFFCGSCCCSPVQPSSSQGYIAYGSGNFDGQGSGHEYFGTVWHPTHGYVNNCKSVSLLFDPLTFYEGDGGRSHWSCDYRQA
eukprot:757833-Hanusia_phi.AAC.3